MSNKSPVQSPRSPRARKARRKERWNEIVRIFVRPQWNDAVSVYVCKAIVVEPEWGMDELLDACTSALGSGHRARLLVFEDVDAPLGSVDELRTDDRLYVDFNDEKKAEMSGIKVRFAGRDPRQFYSTAMSFSQSLVLMHSLLAVMFVPLVTLDLIEELNLWENVTMRRAFVACAYSGIFFNLASLVLLMEWVSALILLGPRRSLWVRTIRFGFCVFNLPVYFAALAAILLFCCASMAVSVVLAELTLGYALLGTTCGLLLIVIVVSGWFNILWQVQLKRDGVARRDHLRTHMKY